MDFETEATSLTSGILTYAGDKTAIITEVNLNIDADTDLDTTKKSAKKAQLSAQIGGISGSDSVANAKLFTFALIYAPKVILNDTALTSKLFGKFSAPKSLRALADILWVADDKAVPKSIKDGMETLDKKSSEEFYQFLKGKKYLAQHYKSLNTSASQWKDAGIDVNTTGLHLLLLQPYMTDVVMQRRKLIAERSMASLARLRSTVVVPSGFIPMMGGSKLDNSLPIEMRGAGQMFSSMRAGSTLGLMGYAIGSPLNSQFSPMDNSLFISSQLSMAYENLKRNIERITGKKTVLSNDVDTEVTTQIQALKDAESQVKKNRDRLTKFNEMIATGQADVKNAGDNEVNKAEIERSVDIYNASQQNRHKLEMKVLRVIRTLGLKYMSLV